jgi:hypothetical protein
MLKVILLICLLVLYTYGLHIPLIRRSGSIANLKRGSSQAVGVTGSVSPPTSLFFVEVSIGTPGQTFEVVIDTGKIK